jgi:hypothetical protein
VGTVDRAAFTGRIQPLHQTAASNREIKLLHQTVKSN